MRLSLLYEFVELSKCLNFSKTAENLYLTQPVLSRHINDLEKQLGVQLLVRDTRNVQLSEAGRIFAEGSRQMIAIHEETLERLQSAMTGIIGTLSVGYLHFAVNNFLSDFILYFLNLYPQIRLEYLAGQLPDLANSLEKDIIDVCFCTNILNANSRLYNAIPVCWDSICVLMPHNHPLCKKDNICIRDLSGEPIIAFPKENNPWVDIFQQKLFSNHKANYNLAIEAPNIETAFSYITSGRGVMLVPDHLTHMSPANIVKRELNSSDCQIEINLIYKKDNHNPIIDLFANSFRSFSSLPENEKLFTR